MFLTSLISIKDSLKFVGVTKDLSLDDLDDTIEDDYGDGDEEDFEDEEELEDEVFENEDEVENETEEDDFLDKQEDF